MPDIFKDFVASINSKTKKNAIETADNQEAAEADYKPFVVNRAFSYFPDTILFANEMNLHPGLDNKLQYDFLLHGITPKKRFSKWFKAEKDDDIQFIADYYKCSFNLAKRYRKLLTDDQIKHMKAYMSEGGKTKNA